MLEPCVFDGQLKSISSEQSDCPSQSSKRQEDTPMEVSSNPPPTDVFKVRYYMFSRNKNHVYFALELLRVTHCPLVFSPLLTLWSPSSRPWSSALVLIQVESHFKARCLYNLTMWSFPRHPLSSLAWRLSVQYKNKKLPPHRLFQCQEILQFHR